MNVDGIEPTDPPNGCGESRIWCIKLLIWLERGRMNMIKKIKTETDVEFLKKDD